MRGSVLCGTALEYIRKLSTLPDPWRLTGEQRPEYNGTLDIIGMGVKGYTAIATLQGKLLISRNIEEGGDAG
ncbi:MAG: hypothetical protein U0K19_03860 [Bifidobacteriaceae bacterium]|nr:hypothetical protein [Bifidobacteriaceae bacterium]